MGVRRFRYARRPVVNGSGRARPRLYFGVGLVWLVVSLVGARSGRLQRLPPPAPQLVLVGLTAALILLTVRVKGLRAWLRDLDLRWFPGPHITRLVIGLYFLRLARYGTLHAAFGAPAGWAGQRRRRALDVGSGGFQVNLKEAGVAYIQGTSSEIHELARYEVRPESLAQCLSAIHDFVAYVRSNEPGALRYEVWQESEHPTRFVHIFIWRDAEAQRIHGESAAVKKFAGILYPNCLAPVEVIESRQVDANATFTRV